MMFPVVNIWSSETLSSVNTWFHLKGGARGPGALTAYPMWLAERLGAYLAKAPAGVAPGESSRQVALHRWLRDRPRARKGGFMNKRVLITGAAGQLGRALLATAPSGVEAVAATRATFDLGDPDAVLRAVRSAAPDIVVNAGAYVAVDKAESEEGLARIVNAEAVAAIAEAVAETGGKLMQVSTDFVFDGEGKRAYRPDDRVAPLSAYGRSKAAGEAAAGPGATVVRTSWVYGTGGTNFVSTMLRLMATRDEVRVVADQVGAPTETRGLAETIWGLALQDAPGIWHHTDAGIASWYDFAVAIQEEALAAGLLDRAVPIIPIGTADYPTPAARPRWSVLDSSATRAKLGQSAVHWRTRLRAMLKETAALADEDRN